MSDKIPKLKERWCWPQGSNDKLCECINCCRMGRENGVNMENVDSKLPRKGFYHYGRLVPQSYYIHPYIPEYVHKSYHMYYSPEQLRPR